LDAAGLPLLILAVHVLGDKPDARLGTDKLFGIILGLEKGEAQMRVAIGWGDFNPPPAILKAVVHHHSEPQFIDIKTQASVQITDVDDHKMQTEIRVLAIEAEQRSFNPKR
jgi:hypothetical protein